ncbi:carbohydrate ABC transporter permease [Phycicoccus sonneratiae]|uniref:Sugar ABC transporter permease n=1 Tax=Phycicoccus sonneratiae TaxID=2807628 RepID=A0ABS2CJG1_9MICO|nr:sugar ABC transporter permease [Phycicoccus sonneraticus]MBM6400023.1 sugar ABC transporter permease [Phycicoccus sonneraticus]
MTSAPVRLGPRRALRRRGPMAPYLLVAPAVAVVLGILGWPLAQLVAISFQRYGLAELIRHRGRWVGLDNYASIVRDPDFWLVALRTTAFTAVTVLATMLIGVGLAFLLRRVRRLVKLLLTVTLVFVWATPVVVGVSMWQWLVDYEFGVVNWVLGRIGVDGFPRHNWFEDPVQGLAVVGAVVVWGAVPFVAITVHAALSQVPEELREAAVIDGASAPQVARLVTLPLIRPVLNLVVVLEIIWNFQVFSQLWIMVGGRPTQDYQLFSVYAYTQSFGISQYGRGAAIAVVMVLALAGLSVVYVRRMLATEATS